MDKLKAYISEGIGTMCLVFVGCATIVIGGDLVAIALAFGLIYIGLYAAIAKTSGCHVNPAISLAMLIQGKIQPLEFVFYIIAQFIGALLGAVFVALCHRGIFNNVGANYISEGLYKTNNLLQAEKDGWYYVSGILMELILSFIFGLSFLGACEDKEKGGMTIGLTYVLVNLVGFGYTKCCVNPWRGFATGIVEACDGNTASIEQCWLWIIFPFGGCALAALVSKLLGGTTGGK